MKLTIAALVLLCVVSIGQISEAAQSCCGVDDTPCDWWNPCKTPVPDAKIEKAKAYSRYLGEARNGLGAFALGSCSASIFLPFVYGPACITATAGAYFADAIKQGQDQIIADGPQQRLQLQLQQLQYQLVVNQFDENYWQLYEGYYRSYNELGIDRYAGQGEGYLDNLGEHTQVADMLADRVAVSANRANSCYSLMLQGVTCGDWQSEWTWDNTKWLGQRLEAAGNNLWYQLDTLVPYVGQGVNPDMLNANYNLAAWTIWIGREYQK